MKTKAISGFWLVLGCTGAWACREPCTADEIRYGDKCVMRPVRDAGNDPSREPGSLDGEAGAPDSSESADHLDATEPTDSSDPCPDGGCEAPCTEGCAVDPCVPNPCANGGTCSVTGKLCTCVTGFSGPTCETDACEPNPCQHGGVCSRVLGGAACECSSTGARGSYCETDIDECGATNVCSGLVEGVAFTHTCKNEQPFYSCVGQFPDWSLTDPADRFSSSTGFPIVEDSKTGLTWQRGAEGPMPLAAARSYCDALTTASFADWRLPTKAELESIIDFGKVSAALSSPFAGGGDWYWTGSPVVGSTMGEIWIVDFTFGETLRSLPTENNRVRCVR